jgi:hypothetical protein
MYVESMPLGIRNKGFQGESYWNAPNPKPGSVFTYYLKDDLKTLKEKRQEAEKQKIKIGDPVYYPSMDTLRLEDIQPAPYLLFTITDETGNVVRRLKAPGKKGLNRIAWDFRTDTKVPVDFTPFDESNVFSNPDVGTLVLPGNYKVSLAKFEDSVYTQLVPPVSFTIEALNMVSMSPGDKKTLYDFGMKVEELQRAVAGTNVYVNELQNKLRYMKQAVLQTPAMDAAVMKEMLALERRLTEIDKTLNGDASLARREFEAPTSLNSRIGSIMDALISTTSPATNTFINSYSDASRQFAPVFAEVRKVDVEVKKLEDVAGTK